MEDHQYRHSSVKGAQAKQNLKQIEMCSLIYYHSLQPNSLVMFKELMWSLCQIHCACFLSECSFCKGFSQICSRVLTFYIFLKELQTVSLILTKCQHQIWQAKRNVSFLIWVFLSCQETGFLDSCGLILHTSCHPFPEPNPGAYICQEILQVPLHRWYQ